MSRKLRPPLSAGKHLCVFEGIVETTGQRYGDGYIWTFAGIEGESKGHIARKTTGMTFQEGTSYDEMITSVVGHEIAPNEDVNPDGYIGQKFVVTVNANGQIVKVEPAKDASTT